MTRRVLLGRVICAVALPSVVNLFADEGYDGPRPPKKDIPYLLQAERLIETEFQQAKQSSSKEGDVFSVAGVTSTSRTPLAEPIFLFSPDKITPEQLGLFRFEVKEGRRQLVTHRKHRTENEEKVFHLSLRKLDDKLYRIESASSLEPGEYSLSPEGQNTAFCFTVF